MQYKERPILMAETTSIATFQKIKKETRRVIKPAPIHSSNHPPSLIVFGGGVPVNTFAMPKHHLKGQYNPTTSKPWEYYGIHARVPHGTIEGQDKGCSDRWVHCPYGKPGDTLWVREAFAYLPDGQTVVYRAGGYVKNGMGEIYKRYDRADMRDWKWKPSIFMPRSASRMNLIISSINAEPLLDITEEGAAAEGFKSRKDFLGYWEYLNGIGSAEKNPWVWVIKYECEFNYEPLNLKKTKS